MYCKFGTYQHPDNEAIVTSFDVRRTHSARGVPDIETRTVTIRGVLIPSSPSQTQITTDINTLLAAYVTGNKDFGFYDDSNNLTPHKLINADSIGGVRIIKKPSFPEGDGAEYATQRTYEIILEADYRATVGLLSFTESTSITGTGAAKVVWRHCINAPPVPQQVYPATSVKGTQRGEEVRSDGFANAPGRLFGGEHGDRRGVQKSISDDRGRKIYRTTWNYNFENNNLRLIAPHLV